MTADRLRRWVDEAVPSGLEGEARAKARLLTGIALSTWGWGPLYAAAYWFLGSTIAGIAALICTMLIVTIPALMRRGAPVEHLAHMLLLGFGAAVAICGWRTGGLASPALAWLAIVPLTANATLGSTRGTALWTALVCIVLAIFAGLHTAGIPVPRDVSSGWMPLLAFGALLGVVSAGLLFVWIYDSARRDAIERLERGNAELTEARDRATTAEQRMGRFLADMSHEIRTPLNGVIGMADLMRGTTLNAEQQQYSAAIRASSDALMGIVNDVLDLSKLEAGQLEPVSTPFDPSGLVGDAASVLSGTASARGLDLVAWVDPGVPARIMGDAARLRQVLLNLAGNAVKFTDSGSVSISMIPAPLPTQSGEAGIRCIVRDTGVGIAADELQRLFEPFQQASSSVGRGGTGLGLVISRHIVERMGGAIQVESVPNVGTTFWFDIPAAAVEEDAFESLPLLGKHVVVAESSGIRRMALQAHLVRMGATVHAVGTVAATHAAGLDPVRAPDLLVANGSFLGYLPPTIPTVAIDCDARSGLGDNIVCHTGPIAPPMVRWAVGQAMNAGSDEPFAAGVRVSPARRVAPGTRVLVVDDTEINRGFAMRVLSMAGCEVLEAASGPEAIRMLDTESVELVLMDFRMPGMTGPDATRLIHERARERGRPCPPIVALTAAAMPDEIAECNHAGMDEILIKPIRPDQLRAVVERFTGIEGAA
ncbi:MAG: signal transduction histidine kinase/CheY-like chemotaxis protein [Myxococcota bacterium]|jgi:signal transduction histidine kinase/CheY-like chemotaxis protein